MKSENLLSISPLDGRYNKSASDLRAITSEFGLIKYRVIIEIKWFLHLSSNSKIKELPKLNIKEITYLNDLISNFDITDAKRVKAIEKKTNHDVKAVEYFLKEKFKKHKKLDKYSEFIHFACTSEDINNLSYALMIKDASAVVNILINKLEKKLKALSKRYSGKSMLSRTHGQNASPTTMGKEFSNYFHRINKVSNEIKRHEMTGKINGAVGNYNAHHVAYPNIDWEKVAKDFVKSLKLNFNSHTTQVEPKDSIALLLGDYVKLNNILIDLSRDIWGYISLGYFKQKLRDGEVGSSTMPHKVNPIDFENAEGNFGLSNSLNDFFGNKLSRSRLQRDLSDSTVQRNIGLSFAYSYIGLESLNKGMNKISPNKDTIMRELDNNWEVLTEAVQTVMRYEGIDDAYEQLKTLSRGKKLDKSSYQEFISNLEISTESKNKLLKLTPSKYIGLAKYIK